MTSEPQLLTSGQIANRLQAKAARVRHILSTREHIQPVGRAGLACVYPESSLAAVAAELRDRAQLQDQNT